MGLELQDDQVLHELGLVDTGQIQVILKSSRDAEDQCNAQHQAKKRMDASDVFAAMESYFDSTSTQMFAWILPCFVSIVAAIGILFGCSIGSMSSTCHDWPFLVLGAAYLTLCSAYSLCGVAQHADGSCKCKCAYLGPANASVGMYCASTILVCVSLVSVQMSLHSAEADIGMHVLWILVQALAICLVGLPAMYFGMFCLTANY